MHIEMREVRKWRRSSHDTHKRISCHITLMLTFQGLNKSNPHRAINYQFPVKRVHGTTGTTRQKCNGRLEQNIQLVFSACSLNTNCSDLLPKRVGKSSASLSTFVFSFG